MNERQTKIDIQQLLDQQRKVSRRTFLSALTAALLLESCASTSQQKASRPKNTPPVNFRQSLNATATASSGEPITIPSEGVFTKEIVEQIREATCLLYVTFQKKTKNSKPETIVGTGWFAATKDPKKSRLITAGHVLNYIGKYNTQDIQNIDIVRPHTDANYVQFTARSFQTAIHPDINYGGKNDIGVISFSDEKIQHDFRSSFFSPTLEYNPSYLYEAGKQLYIAGYPIEFIAGSQPPTYHTEYAVIAKEIQNETDGIEVLAIEDGGASGSPAVTIDKNGNPCVIGMAVGGIKDRTKSYVVLLHGIGDVMEQT